MTIKRIVNGVEVEFHLTHEERWDAYIEEQALLDYSDVEARYGYDNYFTEEEMKMIAQEMRRDIDRSDDETYFAMDRAIESLNLNHRFDMETEEWDVKEFKIIEGVNLTVDDEKEFFRSPKDLMDALKIPEDLRVDIVRKLLMEHVLDLSAAYEGLKKVVLEIVPCAD